MVYGTCSTGFVKSVSLTSFGELNNDLPSCGMSQTAAV